MNVEELYLLQDWSHEDENKGEDMPVCIQNTIIVLVSRFQLKFGGKLGHGPRNKSLVFKADVDASF